MKRALSTMLGLFLVWGVLWAAPVQATTEKGPGVITNDVWTESQDPYLIKGDLVINSLTIEEGTEVIVQGDYVITVAGQLIVNGEPSAPVVIRSSNDTKTAWKGIVFAESQEGSRFQDAEISNARTGVTTNRRTWTIEESYFHDNETGAQISGAPVGDTATGNFKSNYLEDNTTGVKVASRVARFELNTMTDNQDGISFSTTNGRYNDNNIFENSRWNATTCDSVGADMTVNAQDNWWGAITDANIKADICDGNDVPDHAASPEVDIGGFKVAPVEGAASLEDPSPSPSPSPSVSTSPTTPPPPTTHSRTVTLNLRRHLRARGTATVADGFAGCVPATVTINHKKPGGMWRAIKTVPYDSGTSSYATTLRDRVGKYQATISEVATDADVCLAAASAKIRHLHRR